MNQQDSKSEKINHSQHLGIGTMSIKAQATVGKLQFNLLPRVDELPKKTIRESKLPETKPKLG